MNAFSNIHGLQDIFPICRAERSLREEGGPPVVSRHHSFVCENHYNLETLDSIGLKLRC